jgi:hypothetical protein
VGLAVGDSLDVKLGVTKHPKTNPTGGCRLKRRNAGKQKVRNFAVKITSSLPPHMDLGRDAGHRHSPGLASGGNSSTTSKIAKDPGDLIVGLTMVVPDKFVKAATSSPQVPT